MAHVGDKCDVCGRHDLLPLRCDLCSLRCCTEHIPPPAHDCVGREDNTSTARPAAVGLGAALQRNMEEVARRFEGQEWSKREHFRVKASAAEAAVSQSRESKYMAAYRAKVQAGGMNAKQKRVSQQVRRMLIKSKATGRSSLHQDDRYYLEVRFGGLAASDEEGAAAGAAATASNASPPEVVDYVFVSRLWTLGRTLDEVAGKHEAALKKAYPGEASRLLFLNERTGQVLTSLGTAMMDFAPTELESCDCLVLLPAGAAATAAATTASAKEGGDEGATTAAAGAPQEESAPAPAPAPPAAEAGQAPSASEAAAATAAAAAASSESSAACALTIVVQQGKTAHAIGFTDAEWQALTVGDLKARIAAASGVRPERQKLLFKGVLTNDALLLKDTQLKDKAKVTMMSNK